MEPKKKNKIISAIRRAVSAATHRKRKADSPLKPGKKKGEGSILESPSSLRMFPRHGETQVVAFLRDPYCLYVYWEVAEESLGVVKTQLGDEYLNSARVLRVFRTGQEGVPILVQEIRVEPGEMNRYVELQEPTGDYFIEVGQKTAAGRYVPFARSNKISTPVAVGPGSSAMADPHWAQPPGLSKYFGDISPQGQAPKGISSAENQRGMRKGYWASVVK
jgi:hypothetical protein